jgi:hypothetical protein
MTQQVTVNEILQTAINAERMGVPIDWKNLCFTVANVATQVIENLEQQLSAASGDTDMTGVAGEDS